MPRGCEVLAVRTPMDPHGLACRSILRQHQHQLRCILYQAYVNRISRCSETFFDCTQNQSMKNCVQKFEGFVCSHRLFCDGGHVCPILLLSEQSRFRMIESNLYGAGPVCPRRCTSESSRFRVIEVRVIESLLYFLGLAGR